MRLYCLLKLLTPVMVVILVGAASSQTSKFKVLHAFSSGTDGENPQAGLVLDAQGNLYGTTTEGGPAGSGTVFELNTNGKEAILHAFASSSGDGSFPIAGLVRDLAGNLYGTTS